LLFSTVTITTPYVQRFICSGNLLQGPNKKLSMCIYYKMELRSRKPLHRPEPPLPWPSGFETPEISRKMSSGMMYIHCNHEHGTMQTCNSFVTLIPTTAVKCI
ncbi:unnamed protein product, partial [Ixodes pacificus]